jgi:hypothetical protein
VNSLLNARRLAILAILAIGMVATAACSGADEPGVTVGPQEPATMAEVDAAVAAAAQVLLDANGIRITAVYFGVEEPEQAARFDWLEYRSDGDFFLVQNQREPRLVEAFIQVDGELFTATTTGESDEPWSALGAQPDRLEELLDLLTLLATIAEQPSQLVAQGAGPSQVSRQQDSEGNVLWTYRVDSSDGDIIEFAAQWLINGDGVLQFYRVGSEAEPISGSSGIVYEFGVADDLEPLDPPVLGSQLDLEERGVPGELIDVTE